MHLYGVLLTAWMYLTPIFYPISMVPETVKQIIYFNPMYYFIEIFREIVLYGQVPDFYMHMTCIALIIISLCIGIVSFYKKQKNFILYF